MRVHNLTPFPFGAWSTSREPPRVEMTAVVRARFALVPGQPLRPATSEQIDATTLEGLAEVDGDEARAVGEVLSLLGQAALRADRYRNDDPRQQGEVLYPGDFADFKPSAEVMLRGCCHAPKETDRCVVELSVGSWSKKLAVVGTRVRLDEVAGKSSDPAPFRTMPVDYAHAYGGPGFAANPVGKGHLTATAAEIDESVYLPPRSERSRVMASKQLPNVLFEGGAPTAGGLPAGFGPLSPSWEPRVRKKGTRYDEGWLRARAPFYATDFDWTYFHSAPPDQVLAGYLEGDEPVRLRNLHPASADFTVNLPGLRIRVFVMNAGGQPREVPMRLDTLFVDTDESSLYLTWRGLTPAADRALSGVAFALVASEPLAGEPRPASHYHALLAQLEADPIGLDAVMPPGLAEARQALEEIEQADDDRLAAMLSEGDNAVVSLLGRLGPVTGGARALSGAAVGTLAAATHPAQLRDAVQRGLRSGGANASEEAARQRAAKMKAELDGVREQAGDDPALAGASDELGALAGDGAEATTGEDYAGQDLTGRDFSGRNLAGASFRGAVLDGATFAGASLVDASLRGAQLAGTDLTGADLTGADLSHASLHRAKASRSKLAGARLEMAQLRQVDFTGAVLTGASGLMVSFSQCDLSGVNAVGIALEQASFDESVLDDADLSRARLSGARFRACRGSKLCLDGATLDRAGFRDAVLPGLRARGARGEQTVWQRADLRDADFSGARLPKGLFQEASARKATFYSADVRDGRFDEASLEQVTFARANLSHATLRGAGLEKVSFAGATLFETAFLETRGKGCDFTGADVGRALFFRSEVRR